MKDIHIISDTFSFVVNNTEYNLKYRDRIYTECATDEKIKIKNKRVGRITVDGKKYFLSSIENISTEQRNENIEFILNKKCKNGCSFLDNLIDCWERKSEKTKNNFLHDESSLSLEKLADYILSGNEGSDILDKKSWERIKEYEVASFDHMTFDDENLDITDSNTKTYEKNKITKDQKKKRDALRSGQTKRWNNSTTKKMDSIVSYSNIKDTEEFILGKQIIIKPRIEVKYDRLIDPNRPYVVSWCNVNEENEFEFNQKKFTVIAKQYTSRQKGHLYFIQDKILCYFQDNNYFFFDMNIDRISEEDIREEKDERFC